MKRSVYFSTFPNLFFLCPPVGRIYCRAGSYGKSHQLDTLHSYKKEGLVSYEGIFAFMYEIWSNLLVWKAYILVSVSVSRVLVSHS